MAVVTQRRKITPPALAKTWGVSTAKVIAFIRSGELKAISLTTRTGGRPRYAIDLADVERFELARQIIPDNGESTTRKLRRQAAAGIKEFF